MTFGPSPDFRMVLMSLILLVSQRCLAYTSFKLFVPLTAVAAEAIIGNASHAIIKPPRARLMTLRQLLLLVFQNFIIPVFLVSRGACKTSGCASRVFRVRGSGDAFGLNPEFLNPYPYSVAGFYKFLSIQTGTSPASAPSRSGRPERACACLLPD